MPATGAGQPAVRPDREAAPAQLTLPRPDHGRVTGSGAPRRARRAAQPIGLLAASLLVAAVLILPLVFLLVEAQGAGVSRIAALIDRPLTAQLLWNTIRRSDRAVRGGRHRRSLAGRAD